MTQVQAQGTAAISTVQHQSSTQLPFAFAGLSRFIVQVTDGVVTPGFPLSPYFAGVNLQILDFGVSTYSSGLGNVGVTMECEVAGHPRVGSTQTTFCRGDHVLVFAEPTYMFRPTPQPEEQFSAFVGSGQTMNLSRPPIPGHSGNTPCSLARFRFEIDEYFKYNELVATATDCDSAYGGQAYYLVKVQGDSFKDSISGLPDQSAVAFNPEPSGAPYVWVGKPRWSGLIWLDTAILE